ncbi:MAG: sulfatase-like hydrolase/transferase [Puniceicoccales bacterium]|jgi:arylsulfatase A-like enzyme|nr:sulfatase-like hydrolase/transferase [Puniceicoccales bacterium]
MLKTLFKLTPVLAFSSLFANEAPKPNIIFILVDDLGYGDLGAFYQNQRAEAGLPAFTTPNLDRLVTDGLRLNRHYCPAPVCAPSRASLLSGVHQGHASVRNNQFDSPLSANHTLGTVMKQAGYATANIGKWGLQGSGTNPVSQMESFPLKRGFDFFFGYVAHGFAHYHYPKEVATSANPNGMSSEVQAFFENNENIVNDMDKCYSTDVITARTKKWIVDQNTANPSQPFFIYLAYTAPHARLNVPTQAYPAGGGLTGGMQWLGTPGNLINTASGTTDSYIHPDYANATYNNGSSVVAWPTAEKRHATMIRRLDDAVADLRQLLVDLNIADNTLIVFTSDNGPHAEGGTGGSFTQNPQFFRSYANMDGIKRDMWEGGARVPAIVTWPAKIQAGSQSSFPSQFHDWMPTFAELAGLPAPERSDGISLVPTLTGSPENQKTGVVYAEYAGSTTPSYSDFDASHRGASGQEQMIYVNGYKAIRYGVTSNSVAFRVYDTLADPQEINNLAGTAGVPTQAELEARVLQVRRAGNGSGRSYDTTQIPAVSVSQVTPGLHYRTYEKSTPWVPNWENETPATSGETTTPSAAVTLAPTTDGGALITGYINVPSDGSYTFYLTADSNNGAFIRLHDAQLIDADYGYVAGTEVNSGSIPLKAGYHPISIHYRHAAGATRSLSLKWQGPGITKQDIPAAAYFRDGVPELTAVDDEFSFANNNGASAILAPLANDLGSEISISAITQPHSGSASISPDKQSIIYTPKSGFFGKDVFTYTITDGTDTRTAKITVNVARLISSDFLWMPLDETSGNLAYDAGGNPVGMVSGTPGYIAGMSGGAYQFNGTTDEIVIANADFAPPSGSAARTIAAWLKVPTTAQPQSAAWFGYGTIPNATSSSGKRFSLRVENGKLRCEVQAGNAVGTKLINDGQWHHVAVVVPAGATNVTDVLFYIDGAVDAKSSSTAQALNTDGTNNIVIANAAAGSTYHFAGGIDDLRIYARELSLTEIQEIKTRASSGTLAVADSWFYQQSGNAIPTTDDWHNDSDNDGFSPLLEFALGGSLSVNDSDWIAPQLYKGGDIYQSDFRFVFNRRQSLPLSTYIVETSETLKADSWTSYTGSLSVEAHPQLSGFDQATALLPNNNKSLFARLRVAMTTE